MPGMKSVVGRGGTGNARELAEMLRQLGRGRDTVLAHITPEEAQMLMDMGGSGTINPNTGLPEFQEDFYDYGESYGNVTGAPVDYSYMAPESVSIESNYPRDMTGFRQPTGFGQAFEPQPESMAGLSPELQRSVAEMPPGMRFDIAPQVSPFQREAPGIVPREALPPIPEPPSIAQRAEGALQNVQDIMSRYPKLTEALGVGAKGIVGLIQARRAREQGREAAARFSALGAPMRQEAENLRQQALAGALTPQQAREQEVARARARQAAGQRGATTGTQAAMIENQLSRARAEMSQTNLNNALKMLNLANAYDEAAIKAQLSADQEADQILAEIYQNIAFTSSASRGTPNQPRTTVAQQEITRRPELPRG